MYGWLGFDFPDAGTQILVFLSQNEQSGLSLTGDANNVAIVDKDDSVQLCHGSTMGKWTPEHYEEAYQAFILNKKNASKQHQAEDQAQASLDSLQKSMEPVEPVQKSINVTVVSGVILLLLVLIVAGRTSFRKK